MLIEERLNQVLKEKYRDKKVIVRLGEFFNSLYIYKIREVKILKKGKEVK